MVSVNHPFSQLNYLQFPFFNSSFFFCHKSCTFRSYFLIMSWELQLVFSQHFPHSRSPTFLQRAVLPHWAQQHPQHTEFLTLFYVPLVYCTISGRNGISHPKYYSETQIITRFNRIANRFYFKKIWFIREKSLGRCVKLLVNFNF